MAKRTSTATYAGIPAFIVRADLSGAPRIRQCAAVTAQSGYQVRCRAAAMRGKEVCRLHGGKAGRKVTTGVGAYDVSRVAGRVAEAYQRHRDDPDYTSLRDTIALLKAYLEQYITTHTPNLAYDPPPLTSDFFSTLLSFSSRLSRLAKSQAEIEWGPQHLITATQAMTFYQAVLEGVRRHVIDVAERERVFSYVESTLGLAGLETREVLGLPASRPADQQRENGDSREIRVEASG